MTELMVNIFVLDGLSAKTNLKVHVTLDTNCRVSENEHSLLAELVAHFLYQNSKAYTVAQGILFREASYTIGYP